jgi:MoaA/NifB/PqqE/SkfB family radical SAM enzyme
MQTALLYCIDHPALPDRKGPVELIKGWLLCTRQITGIRVPKAFADRYAVEYGWPRPDVSQHFSMLPSSGSCGLTLKAVFAYIPTDKPIELEIALEGEEYRTVFLDLSSSTIRDIDLDEKAGEAEQWTKKTETQLLKFLRKQAWITIRMDITNKCNLRCIMCHYKEQEVYSQPTKLVTPDVLHQQLKEIGPFVKHIMLSCGFEPLMSKHFGGILSMLRSNFPHMEIGLCTNGMLLDSKARKAIMENKVSHMIFSLDGVNKATVERIRAGANYERILGNIMALRDLKKRYNRNFPLMFMDFVLMNSNIHEAPAFIKLCAELGIHTIDFRHLVGNIYFNEHEEMLTHQPERYNYYRQLIINEAKKYPVTVRLPEAFANTGPFNEDALPLADLKDFHEVAPDLQTEAVADTGDFVPLPGIESEPDFLAKAECLRPFNEIMIAEGDKIMPCSYYTDAMGRLEEGQSLYSIFFNETYAGVRYKKMRSLFDHHCLHCPIRLNLLPTRSIT